MLQIDVGGGFQLEAEPASASHQQADSQPQTIAADSTPDVLAPLHSGHKRKRADAKVSLTEDKSDEGHESDSKKKDGHTHVQKSLETGLTAAGREEAAGISLWGNSGDEMEGKDNDDDDDVTTDDEDDDDDLLVVKRRDVLDSSNDGATPAEGIPLGAVELRGNKKKKRLRIDPGRTSGARTVFDDEGESLQPLALLAKQQLDRWGCNQSTVGCALTSSLQLPNKSQEALKSCLKMPSLGAPSPADQAMAHYVHQHVASDACKDDSTAVQ